MLKGKIVKNISNLYQVLSNNKYYDCKPRGLFRELGITPLVGGEVESGERNNDLLRIEPRKSELERPSVSNIDIALIVTSVKNPNISLNLLDKEISSIILSKIEPVICFTKLDLLSNDENNEVKQLQNYYQSIGIKVFDNNHLTEIKNYLKSKNVVLTGQTGAGKSSLINKLDKTKSLKVGEISKSLGRGRHTTRHTEFHEVCGIYIADTPGFSQLELNKYSKEQIRDSFIEFKKYSCEYKDCMHIKEQNCTIKEQVVSGNILKSRYDNYCSLIK